MKIIAIVLLALSFNSYSELITDFSGLHTKRTLEECNVVAAFRRATLEAAMSGVSVAAYIEGLDQSKIEEAIALYLLYNSYATALINGHFKEVDPDFWIHTDVEGELLMCYERALENG